MSATASASPGFFYESSVGCCSNAYLVPRLRIILKQLGVKRLFDLGCGNGAVAHLLSQEGYQVTGVDPSEDGIRFAQQAYPNLKLQVGSAYDDLAGKYGQYPVVISLEVVEHVYSPRLFARCLRDLLEPGGHAIVSTPYHSYLKYLALALSGRMEKHLSPLWDHGHIKFWSIASLTMLLNEVGLEVTRVDRVGRIPILAKSMILTARRPD